MNENSSYEPRHHRRRWIAALLILLLLVDIIFTTFIFLDVRLLKSPETTIQIDLVEVNSEEILLEASVQIHNPNAFTLLIQDLEIMTQTPQGVEVAHMLLEGGELSANEQKEFTTSESIRFAGESPDLLTTTVKGIIGVNVLGFLKKTVPLTVHVITSAEDVLTGIESPVIHVEADFGDLTKDGIQFEGTLDVYNPNSFAMQVEDIFVSMETDTGETVGFVDISGGSIEGKSTAIFTGNGEIRIEALNAEFLIMNVSGGAGATLGGIEKTLQFSAEATITVPRLEDLLSKGSPTEMVIKSDMKPSLRGFISDITLEIVNPNKIGLEFTDIELLIYSVNNDEEELIGSCTIDEAIAGPESETSLSAEIVMSYSKLLFSGRGLRPEWMLLTVRANLSAPGLDQTIWLAISGYSDMHLFI
jgi:LEA14-like dessication related protein